MRNSGATSQNSVLFSARHFRIRDTVRPYRIQLRMRQHPHSLAAAVRALRLLKLYVSRQN